jgi:hypothetical protein
LPLGHVVLLGEQAARAAAGPGPLEAAQRLGLQTLLVTGQGQEESAQHEPLSGSPSR